jgi:hypothetical protein
VSAVHSPKVIARRARLLAGLAAVLVTSCDSCGQGPAEPVVTYSLTVAASGTGDGRVTGLGFDCVVRAGTVSGACTNEVIAENGFALTASVDEPSLITGWTNCTIDDTYTQCGRDVLVRDMTVTVSIERVSLVEIMPAAVALELGDFPQPLTALARNSHDELIPLIVGPDFDREFVWTVDNPAVAEVLSGSGPGSTMADVSPVAPGATTVRAGIAGITGSAGVTVVDGSVIDATIRGTVRDTMSGPGLQDVFVQAIHEMSGGLPPVLTDATGAYEIPVTEAGVFSLCAIASIPRNAAPQRFVNTNCAGETVTVIGSGDYPLDLTIETGYYLAITGGPYDLMATAGSSVPLTFGYRAWNRSSVPVTTSWIAIGLEVSSGVLQGQATALGANAGPFGNPNLPAAGPGPVTVQLTAPATVGSYDIYARLLPLATAAEATAAFESGFPTARERNYVKIGTLTVTSF